MMTDLCLQGTGIAKRNRDTVPTCQFEISYWVAFFGGGRLLLSQGLLDGLV